MKWYYNMKIAAKLLVGFILVAIIAGAVGVVGIVYIKDMEENDKNLYENMTVPMSDADDIAECFQMARVYSRDMIMEQNPTVINEYYSKIKDLGEQITQYAENIKPRIASDEEQAAFDQMINSRAEYQKHLANLLELCLVNNDTDAMVLLRGDMVVSATAEQEAITNFVQLKMENAKVTSDSNQAAADTATTTMIIIAAFAVLLSIVLGIFISRIISGSLKKITKTADVISRGDFNIELDIDTKDEVGHLAESFRRMAFFLNEMMTNINASSEQVAAGAKQVSESSMLLSQGATEQASSIEQLTASIEEISSQTKLNTENANEANKISDEAKTDAEKGNVRMKEMLKAMDEINESSGNISKIIKVIDDIAFQTNLLALNAAVEAARAGQHGKGFAVVAEEVRNLAARSANAAKETTGMIEGSIKKVDDGTKIANQTADELNAIVKDITKVSSLIGNIALASNEQSSAIEQINQAVMQVSAVVQTNSSTAEESAAASEELSGQAELLKQQVANVKLRKDNKSGSRREYGNQGAGSLTKNAGKKQRKNIAAADNSLTEEQEEPTNKGRTIELNDVEFGKY